MFLSVVITHNCQSSACIKKLTNGFLDKWRPLVILVNLHQVSQFIHCIWLFANLLNAVSLNYFFSLHTMLWNLYLNI